MLIDWHVHIHDIKDQVNPYWRGRCPMTPENVLAAHKLAGLDRTVISNAVHYLRFCKTAKETADALGLPLGTVKSRIHHALRDLRGRLNADRRFGGAWGEVAPDVAELGG